MRLILNIKDIDFRNELAEYWWRETDYLEIVIQCIEQCGLLKYVKYFLYDDREEEVNNTEDILTLIRKIKSNRDIFYLCHKKSREQTLIDFVLRPDFFGLQIECNNNLINDENIITTLVKLSMIIYQKLKDVALFGDNIKIWIADFDYPRIKPPRNTGFIGSTGVVNIIHKEYFEKNPHLKFEGFEKLFTEKLPEGTTRETIDDLCIIKWCSTINDTEKLKNILMKRESWLYNNFKLPVDSGFNENGDKLMVHLGELPKSENRDSFFTFYDPIGKTGFKPIVLNENNYLAPDVEKVINRYIESGVLENGDPLDNIVLILPDRKYVIEIYERVKKIGVYKVIYTDNKGMLWNPFPPGNWRE